MMKDGFDVKALRAFRVLRPLRLVSGVPSKCRAAIDLPFLVCFVFACFVFALSRTLRRFLRSLAEKNESVESERRRFAGKRAARRKSAILAHLQAPRSRRLDRRGTVDSVMCQLPAPLPRELAPFFFYISVSSFRTTQKPHYKILMKNGQ